MHGTYTAYLSLATTCKISNCINMKNISCNLIHRLIDFCNPMSNTMAYSTQVSVVQLIVNIKKQQNSTQ